MDKDLINALARLERAGSENSKATAKLHWAATIVAEEIEKNVPTGVWLPRDYKVIRHNSNIGSDLFLVQGRAQYGEVHHYIDGIGGYLHGDFNCSIPPKTRTGSLKFAKDVSAGLLEEIAEFLEKRTTAEKQAASTLEAAVKNARSLHHTY